MKQRKTKPRLRKRPRQSLPPNAQNPTAPPERDERGRYAPGNTAQLRHGLRSARARQALLPGQEVQLAALSELRAELYADLGGIDALGVVKKDAARRFLELTVVADTLVTNLLHDGIISPKGRQRAALSAYLSVVDRLTKLSTLLGLERKTKRVETIDDFLRARAEQQQAQQPSENEHA